MEEETFWLKYFCYVDKVVKEFLLSAGHQELIQETIESPSKITKSPSVAGVNKMQDTLTISLTEPQGQPTEVPKNAEPTQNESDSATGSEVFKQETRTDSVKPVEAQSDPFGDINIEIDIDADD